MDAHDWDQRYAASDLLWTAEPNRFFAAEAESLPPGRALDLACGEGRNAVWLAERGWSVTAVDFSPVGLAKARELATSRAVAVTWVEADVTTWTAEPAAFDLVAHVYLHLPLAERERVIRMAAAATAPGGTLVLVGHDRSNVDQGVGGPQDPAILATADEVVPWLDGLDLVRAGTVLRPVADDHPHRRGVPGPTDAIDLLVVARRT